MCVIAVTRVSERGADGDARVQSGVEERFRVPKHRIANFFHAVDEGYIKTNP